MWMLKKVIFPEQYWSAILLITLSVGIVSSPRLCCRGYEHACFDVSMHVSM